MNREMRWAFVLYGTLNGNGIASEVAMRFYWVSIWVSLLHMRDCGGHGLLAHPCHPTSLPCVPQNASVCKPLSLLSTYASHQSSKLHYVTVTILIFILLRLLNKHPNETLPQHPFPINPRMHLQKQSLRLSYLPRAPHQLPPSPRMKIQIRCQIVHSPVPCAPCISTLAPVVIF